MKNIGLLLIFSLIAKLILSAWIPLSADESYYWLWSHFPALSYFDHPPFVAWVYSLGHVFENFASAVRWPGVLLGHMTLLIWIHLLRPYLDEKSLFWFTVLALLSPFTGPGSLIVTPDIPLIFFWSLLLWALVQALKDPRVASYAVLGFLLGLGFLSKYTVVLFIPIAFASFLWARWSIGRLLLASTVGIVVFFFSSLPVWVWNMEHDWISFGFQIDHGLGAKTWKPSWTIEYVLGQIALIFPTVLYFAAKNRNAPLWLHLSAWFPLGFFFFTSFRGYAEANWPIVAYLPLLALAVWSPSSFRWAKWTAALWGVCFTLVLSAIASYWLPWDKNKIKLKELFKYEPAVHFAQQHSPVYARTYQMASKISFELKKPVFKLRGLNRFDFFDLRPESLPTEEAFWLIAKPNDQIPEIISKAYMLDKVSTLDGGFEAWRFLKK